MKITCEEHGTELIDNLRCEDCVKKNIERYNKIYAGMNVTYGINVHGTILIDGKPTIVRHELDYVEWQVPTAICNELALYVEKRINEYVALCECASCVLERDKKNRKV